VVIPVPDARCVAAVTLSTGHTSRLGKAWAVGPNRTLAFYAIHCKTGHAWLDQGDF